MKFKPGALGKESWLFFAFAALVLFSAFAPVLTHSYGYSDDYRHLYRAVSHDPTFPHNIVVQGRPLYALAADALYSLAGTVDKLAYVRLAALVGMVLFAMLLWRTYLKAGHDPLEAAGAVLVTSLMPAFGIFAAWGSAFKVPYAAVLAIVAAWLALGACDRTGLKRALPFAAGVFLLLASFMLYQSGSMFFWVALAVLLFARERTDPALVQKSLAAAFVFGAASVLYLVLHKAIAARYVALDPFYRQAASRGALTDDPLHKLQWFMQGPLPDSLSLFLVPSSTALALLAALAIAAGVALRFRRERLSTASLRGWGFLLAAPALLLLAYLPSLVAHQDTTSLRTQAALTGIVVFYVALLINELRLRRAARLSIWLLLLGASWFSAHRHVKEDIVIPQELEYRALRERVSSLEAYPERVAFVLAGKPHPLVARPRHEYGGWVSLAQPWVVEGMTALALQDRFGEIRPFVFHVYKSAEEVPAGEVLIDGRGIVAGLVEYHH
jgi:hypothetical protein